MGAGPVLNFFALTLFVSATLLFWIQPMFTKMVLPLLGGSPAVLAPFGGNERWVPLAEDPELGVWSDDFSNILRSFSF